MTQRFAEFCAEFRRGKVLSADLCVVSSLLRREARTLFGRPSHNVTYARLSLRHWQTAEDPL